MIAQGTLIATNFQTSFLELYSSVVDEFIGVYDVNKSQFIYVNDPGAKMFGFTDSDHLLKDKNFDYRFWKIDEKEHININKRILKDGLFTDNIIAQTRDGIKFYSSLHIHLFKDNEKVFHLVRIKNTNDFKKSIEILLQEKERFEALFNHATLGILLANRNGEIVLANSFSAKQFGYLSASELKGKKVEQLMPAANRKKHIHLREGFNEDPQPRSMGSNMDLHALRKDGTEFPVEISLSHYQTEDGFFAIAFIIDISKRKEIENAIKLQQQEMVKINAEVEKLNDELEEKVAKRTKELQDTMHKLEVSKDELTKALSNERELGDMKTRFVSMASHEFRTPLSTILSSASLVAKYVKGDEQDKRDKHITRIKSSVNNLTDILNDFLSLGKMEDGKIPVTPVETDIEVMLMQLTGEMQAHTKSGQTIIYNHTGSAVISVDTTLLRNSIVNLLSNAIKFSPENKPIQLTSSINSAEFVIIVEDKGIGISQDDQKHLFERFFRANNATNIQGTGLGLHIVAKYVELMGGEIEYASELEKGSKFIIKIKL